MIPIVYSTNSNYCYYLYVSIFSLIKNSKHKLDIFILHDSLNTKEIELLKTLKSLKANINIINVNEFYKNTKFIVSNHITKEAYYRIYIPQIIKNYDKIIYLDCDTIINTDLKKLYDIKLKNNILAGVPDRGVIRIKNYTSKILNCQNEEYINSGVLLIDNTKFLQTEQEIKECLDLKYKNPKLRFHDQDILNLYYKNKILYLDDNWNKQIDLRTTKNLIKNIREISIVHYNGPSKPWINRNNKNSILFWEYAKQTDIYLPILNRIIKRNIIKKILKKIMRKGINYMIRLGKKHEKI